MYLRILCAVFLLSVPLASCVTKSSSTLPPSNASVSLNVSSTSTAPSATVVPTTTLATPTINVTVVNATTVKNDVQRPQLSTLDKYLRSQGSFAIANANEADKALRSSAGAQNVTSKNYPWPYPVTKVVKQRLSVVNASGMNIIINDLDIDPTTDYISLIPLNADGSESRPIILTGKLNQPLSIRSLGYTRANLVFEARTYEGHPYRGFSISYAPYGEVPAPGTQPPDVTLSFDQLQTCSKLLVVPKKDQTDITWAKLKTLFANSTNLFIKAGNLSLEQAVPPNVTLTRVAECFESWPEAENCVEVEFAITLYNDTSKTEPVDPYLEDLTPREPAGLTSAQLEEMWVKFGRGTFKEQGVIEYELPDTRTRILMWVGIAIGSCVLLFLIFVAVFRSPAFRDRWVEDDTIAIKNKDENSRKANDDITMYPSPDQVIPDMYPVTGGSNGQAPSTEFGMDVGRIRPHSFETINEAFTEDEEPSTKMRSRRTEQSQADASV